MRSARWLAVALTVAVASAALGQDAPAPKAKHENVVTPEAKAVLEKFRTLVYRPGDHGLQSLEGTLFAAGFDSRERATFEFTPSKGVSGRVPPAIDQELKRLGLAGNLLRYPLMSALDPSDVVAYREFDAVLVADESATVVAVRAFDGATHTSTTRLSFEASGLLGREEWHSVTDDPHGDYVATYSWAKFGDRHVLDTLDVVMKTKPPARYAYRFRYIDAAGARVPGSYEVTWFLVDSKERKVAFYADELKANGKGVELVRPWKHENQVTPEAKAVMERYQRLVHRPTDGGLASITGTLVNVAGRDESPYTFEFKAGGHLRVSGGAASDASSGRAKMAQVMLGMPLEATLAGVPLADRDEYDARLVDRDGRHVLVVTNFADGVRGRTDEFTFDSLGLVDTSAIDVASADRPVAQTLRLTWEMHADRGRIRTIDFSTVLRGQAGSTRMQYELTYAPIGGFDLVSSYEFIASGVNGGKSMERKATFRLENLVVNGTPVEAGPAPADKK